MTRRAYDLILSEEAVMLLRMIAQGSSRPMTDVDMIKRFLANGIAYDAKKPQEEAAQLVNQFFRVIPK